MSTPSDQLDEITVTAQSTANQSSTTSQTSTPSEQFGRKYSLVVGTNSGSAIDLSQLRFKFFTKRGDFENPNTCDVRVYNLSDKTANKVKGNEFTQLVLKAGYQGNYGQIFIGTICQARIGRENQLDSYVDFTAADGDEPYNYAPVISSVAAGANSPNAILAANLNAMRAGATSGTFGQGYVGQLSSTTTPRGETLYGNARDIMRQLARDNDMSWSIQDGQLTMIPLTSYIPGDAVVISPDTGLVGVPEQTQNGISMRMLLNPYVKIGQTIKLQATVNKLRLTPGAFYDGQNKNLTAAGAKINGQGLYYVMVATHTGDTRGNPWYTDVVCLAVDATLNISIKDFYLDNFYVAGVGPVTRFG
jgi:hypothetical protein